MKRALIFWALAGLTLPARAAAQAEVQAEGDGAVGVVSATNRFWENVTEDWVAAAMAAALLLGVGICIWLWRQQRRRRSAERLQQQGAHPPRRRTRNEELEDMKARIKQLEERVGLLAEQPKKVDLSTLAVELVKLDSFRNVVEASLKAHADNRRTSENQRFSESQRGQSGVYAGGPSDTQSDTQSNTQSSGVRKTWMTPLADTTGGDDEFDDEFSGKSQTRVTLYADAINDGEFYGVREVPTEDTVYELSKLSESSISFRVYPPAYAKVLRRPNFLEGCNVQKVGDSGVETIEQGEARFDGGAWTIVKMARVKFV